MAPGVQTGERAFHRVQMHAESSEGTAVAATFGYPAESASEPDLVRAPNTPQEDYGELAGARPGRSVFGVRQSTMMLRSMLRFEDVMGLLEAALAGGVVPSSLGGGLYSWVYACDNTSDTLVSRTIEVGDNEAIYQVPGALIETLHLSYSALKPGNASPWSVEATFCGYDKHRISAFSSPVVQTAPETAMGHLTRMFYGTASTAFSSLGQLSHALVAFDLKINTGVLLRKQGGTGDKPDSHGRGKVTVTFTAMLEQIADTYTQVWDTFESDAVNPVIPDRRMRIVIDGSPLSGTNDVQTVTITGGPTGGTFTLTFNGQTTAPINYNAAASAVQTALQALSSIGFGNVLCTGGALPGTGVICTFVNDLGNGPQNAMTHTDSLTGGAGPAVAVTHTTPGVAPTGQKSITIDGQVEVTALPVQESDGATRYAMTGNYVRDATLASIIQLTIVNTIATLPDNA